MCRALLKDAQKVTKQNEPVTESFQQATHDKNVEGSISWMDSRKRMAGLVNLIKLKRAMTHFPPPQTIGFSYVWRKVPEPETLLRSRVARTAVFHRNATVRLPKQPIYL